MVKWILYGDRVNRYGNIVNIWIDYESYKNGKQLFIAGIDIPNPETEEFEDWEGMIVKGKDFNKILKKIKRLK